MGLELESIWSVEDQPRHQACGGRCGDMAVIVGRLRCIGIVAGTGQGMHMMQTHLNPVSWGLG